MSQLLTRIDPEEKTQQDVKDNKSKLRALFKQAEALY